MFNRKMIFALTLLAMIGLLTACGGNKDVEDDPTTAAGAGDDTAETLPAEPVGEPEPEPVVTAPDYAAMDPAEYGVEDVFFAFDQYELDDMGMGVLSRNARVLRETDVAVLISGHGDERGTIEYNLALGEKRAKAVKDYLVSLGVPAHRLQITSYGESKPFAMGSSEAAWAQNRRAHFERP